MVGSVPGTPIDLHLTGTRVFVGLANGDIYEAETYQQDALHFTYNGNLFDRPTSSTPKTWGSMKADYR